ALSGISLSLYRGEIVALLGDNGAGKTTVVKTLSGLYPHQEGNIYLHGKLYPCITPAIAREHGIITVHQEFPSSSLLTISQYFFLGNELLISPYFPFLDKKRMAQETRKCLDSLGSNFRKQPNDLLSSLTKGERQILEIARAYYFYTSLIILDEATSSLFKTEYEFVMKLIAKVKKEGGTVLLIDHKVQNIYDYVDRFIILYRGNNVIKVDRDEAGTRDIEKMLISSHLSTVKEMAAGIAHQIRNPLAIMKVSAQMIKEDFYVRRRQKDFQHKVDSVLHDIDMIDLYVNNFLNFTHDEEPYSKRHGVGSVIEEAIEKIPDHILGRHSIIRDIRDPEVEYPMMRSNIVVVLINLLLTTLNAAAPDEEIRILSYFRKQLFIEIHYQGDSVNKSIQTAPYYPLSFQENQGRLSTKIGITPLHHLFQHQHCTVEVGADNEEGKYVRLIL
ncbi:MAG: ATP-binding cassette domain-containing protein, partial [Sediminispirochaetaceae bacterium]